MPPPSNGGFNKAVIYLGRGPTGWVWHGRAQSGDSSAGPGGIRTPRCSSPCLQRTSRKNKDIFFTIHSLIWNPGLLWQHHSCKIIEKSGDINKEFTPAAEEKTKIKGRTNVVHLKNSNGNKGREVLTPVYLFHCCHFLLELTVCSLLCLPTISQTNRVNFRILFQTYWKRKSKIFQQHQHSGSPVGAHFVLIFSREERSQNNKQTI